MRRSYLIPFALIAVAALAQEESGSDEAVPQIVAFTMSDGSGNSKELEAAMSKVRGAYEEKPVLFLTVNLATAGGKNQGAMLFFSLGLPQIWEECKKNPSKLVLVNLDTVTVLATLGGKDKIAEALDKQLAAGEEGGEGCKGGGGDDKGGGDDGCGG